MRETTTITPPALKDFSNEAEIRPYLSRIDVWKVLFLVHAGYVGAGKAGPHLGLTVGSFNWLMQVAADSLKPLAGRLDTIG